MPFHALALDLGQTGSSNPEQHVLRQESGHHGLHRRAQRPPYAVRPRRRLHGPFVTWRCTGPGRKNARCLTLINARGTKPPILTMVASPGSGGSGSPDCQNRKSQWRKAKRS